MLSKVCQFISWKSEDRTMCKSLILGKSALKNRDTRQSNDFPLWVQNDPIFTIIAENILLLWLSTITKIYLCLSWFLTSKARLKISNSHNSNTVADIYIYFAVKFHNQMCDFLSQMTLSLQGQTWPLTSRENLKTVTTQDPL